MTDGIQRGKQSLERLTVNLIPRTAAALDLAMQITVDSKTDTVNRAIQLYAYVEAVINRGGEILLRDPETGEQSVIKLL